MNRQVPRGVWMSVALFLVVVVGVFGFARFVVWEMFAGEDGRGSRAPRVVGLIRIKGTIFNSAEIVSRLDKLRRNPRVKSLLLRIESPGGLVGPTQEIYREIRRFRSSGRSVVASLGSVAASGGYYLATAADKIYANPGTITGSIGVIMVMPNVEKVLGKIGVRLTVIKSAPHKDVGSPFRGMKPKDRAILQRLVDDTYGQFIGAVAAGRKMTIEEARRLADGSIYSGERAKKLRLVDVLGSLQDATLEAARLAGIKGSPQIIDMTPERPFWGVFSRLFAGFDNFVGARNVPGWGEYPAMLEYTWK